NNGCFRTTWDREAALDWMEFTDNEILDYEEELKLEHIPPPKEAKQKPCAKKHERELELKEK
ncbi:hypothetical protein ACJMK2_005188, partial [Sinanodonta woodiana]